MVYSSSGVYALKYFQDASYFLNRHLFFLFVGSVLSLFILAVDYHRLRNFAKPLMICTIVMLVLVLVPGIGRASFGARRWFKFGPVNFQPSEFAKITLTIYLSDFLARKKGRIISFWNGFLPAILVVGLVCLLVVKQPDLGNSLLLGSIAMILLFVSGARIRHISTLILMALPVLYFLVVRVPYRMRRITAFIDPWQDSQGAGFQLSQSQIALGSGGIFGVGLGRSVQKMFYLPAAHTDFILSIIGEELGLVGTLVVVLLFIALILQGARIIKRTRDPFGYYLACGIIAMIGLQALVNIGVSIGALPTKGLPLPFISYGGSALVFNMMAIALLLNISRMEDT